MLKTKEYLKLAGDVTAAIVNQVYYLNMADLCEVLGLNYDEQLQIIQQDDSLTGDFKTIEITYRNNKKDKIETLRAEAVPKWLLQVDTKNVSSQFQSNIQWLKDEAIRLLNEQVLKESAMSGEEIHNFRQNERDARQRKESAQIEVENVENELKKQKGRHKDAIDNLDAGTHPIHEYRSKEIDARKKVDQLQSQLEDQKAELKKQENRHRDFLAQNNIANNMLTNLFPEL